MKISFCLLFIFSKKYSVLHISTGAQALSSNIKQNEELNYIKTVIASLNEIIDEPIAQIIENK